MNASGRLNTCKSRVTGIACNPLTTGARVRNAYATYLLQGDSPEKFGIIPYTIINWPLRPHRPRGGPLHLRGAQGEGAQARSPRHARLVGLPRAVPGDGQGTARQLGGARRGPLRPHVRVVVNSLFAMSSHNKKGNERTRVMGMNLKW